MSFRANVISREGDPPLFLGGIGDGAKKFPSRSFEREEGPNIPDSWSEPFP